MAYLPRRQAREWSAMGSRLLSLVCGLYGLREDELLGDSRSVGVSFPRQVVMYVAVVEMGMGYAETGRLVARHPATVREGVRRVIRLRDQDEKLEKMLSWLAGEVVGSAETPLG